MSTAHQWIRHDSTPIPAAPNQLVAKNQRWAPQGAVPQKSRNVRTAHPCHLDCDFLFPFLRFRTGALFQFNPAGGGIDQSLHRPQYKVAFVHQASLY